MSLTEATIMVPVIVAVAELIKHYMGGDTRWIPLSNVLSGLAVGLLFFLVQTHPGYKPFIESLFYGLLTGLSAGGLYDLGKHTGGLFRS